MTTRISSEVKAANELVSASDASRHRGIEAV
jgi:hypothetical protein